MVQGFLQQADTYNGEELILELKKTGKYTLEQQGVFIVKLMEKQGLYRHIDVAEILGVSRAYVSIRISKALKKYSELPTPQRKMGRPRNRILELDQFIPGQKIPIRLVIKNGSRITNEDVKEYLKLALEHWPDQS